MGPDSASLFKRADTCVMAEQFPEICCPKINCRTVPVGGVSAVTRAVTSAFLLTENRWMGPLPVGAMVPEKFSVTLFWGELTPPHPGRRTALTAVRRANLRKSMKNCRMGLRLGA